LKSLTVRVARLTVAQVDFSQFDEQTFPSTCASHRQRGTPWGWLSLCFPTATTFIFTTRPPKACSVAMFVRSVTGCIRLNDPFDFAYALLAKQESNPKAFFQSLLATGEEATVKPKTACARAYHVPHSDHLT
jgi:hypothetical protein